MVSAPAVWLAFAANAPVRVRSAPVPIVAEVVTFEIVTATAGVNATLPPAAPIFAAFVEVSVAVALKVMLRAPVIGMVWPRSPR